MKHLFLLLLACLLAACASRELHGEGPRVTVDEMTWLAGRLEADFAGLPAGHGRKVAAGKVIIRADGEVIAADALMSAAMRGLTRAGYSETLAAGEPADVVVGSVQVIAEEEGRESTRRYLFEFKLLDPQRVVMSTQQYAIQNRSRRDAWK